MEILAQVPNVELWKVYGSTDVLIAQGDWFLAVHGKTVTSKVGDVTWNLSPSMACLKPSPSSYVFAMDSRSQLYYCVNLPSGVSEDEIRVVEAVLNNFCQYKVSRGFSQQMGGEGQQEEEAIPTGDAALVQSKGKSKTDKVVEGLGKATVAAVKGIQISSEYLSKKIRDGGDMAIRNTKECTEAKPVSETTQKRVKHIKTLSKTVSHVANAAVDVVAGITSQVAEVVVDTVSKRKDGKPDGEKTKAAKRVGASVLVAAAEVWEAMEGAFRLVAKTSAVTTKDVVTHKYGDEMGKVTYDGMSAAGHVADTAYVSRRFGAKAILKSTAKKTAAGFVTQGQSEEDKQKLTIEGKQPLYPQVQKPPPM